MDAPPPPPPPRRPPWFVRLAAPWSALLASLLVLRVLLAVADFQPRAMLGAGPLGPGSLSAIGFALAAMGFVVGLFTWRHSGDRRRGWLAFLMLVHLLAVVLFPPGWVISLLEEPDVRFRVPTDQPVYGLTIDDGLDARTTPLVLDTLRRHGARATFFVLGETLKRLPELAQRCLDEGHELANHQMTDTPSVSLEPDELERRITEAHRLLGELTEPRWFRPGGGLVTDRCREVCRQLGLRTVLGSVFPFDSHLRSARFSRAYLVGRVEPGSIVVLHDGPKRGQRTAATLDAALPRLAERGLRALSLGELFDAEP